jgi:hypothetical protein
MVDDEDEMGLMERAAWRGQKNNAKDRGIGFKFTYEEWIRWWEDELGPDWFKKRGCRRGQFVMARHLDRGNYESGNVKCVLQNSNHIEANLRQSRIRRPAVKLTVDEIREIYLEPELCKLLAKRYGVTAATIEKIKRSQVHRKTTMSLGRPGRIAHWSMSQRRMRLNDLKRRTGRDDLWIRRLGG